MFNQFCVLAVFLNNYLLDFELLDFDEFRAVGYLSRGTLAAASFLLLFSSIASISSWCSFAISFFSKSSTVALWLWIAPSFKFGMFVQSLKIRLDMIDDRTSCEVYGPTSVGSLICFEFVVLVAFCLLLSLLCCYVLTD